MIRRALAWLAFRLWRWLDRDRALAVRGLPMARALTLPASTPDDLLDESLAGRSESKPEFGPAPELQTVTLAPKKPEPMQCSIAEGSEYTVEAIPLSLARLGLTGPTTVRRYKAPYHVVVEGRLACEPSWKPEPSVSTHSVLHVPLTRLCRLPGCRALWQPERDRARDRVDD